MGIFQYVDEGRRAGQEFLGITVGVVTSIEDPEKRSRVKVKLLNRTTSDYETDFIRVMTPMCGEKWGAFFFPEVGDEVIVAFCDGDIARPYVLGTLWNKKHAPPAQLEDQENNTRTIKSKSGHELVFYDKKDSEYIEVTTAKGLQLRMDDAKKEITVKDKDGKNLVVVNGEQGTVTVTAEKTISLAAGSSKLTLDGQGNSVKLESGGSLELSAQQVKIDAKSTLNISGQATVEVKSSGQLTLQASGPANLKGAIVKIN